jgi:hypothetical protein
LIVAIAKIILYTRILLKDGTYPVKLRVTHDRKSKYFETIYCFQEKEFDRILLGKRVNQDQEEIQEKIFAMEKKPVRL